MGTLTIIAIAQPTRRGIAITSNLAMAALTEEKFATPRKIKMHIEAMPMSHLPSFLLPSGLRFIYFVLSDKVVFFIYYTTPTDQSLHQIVNFIDRANLLWYNFAIKRKGKGYDLRSAYTHQPF
jgi:hypothetical protein